MTETLSTVLEKRMFPVNVTLRQLAELVEGRLEGEAELEIHAARPLHEAGAGHIAFLDNDKNLPRLRASGAAAAVVGPTTLSAGKSVIRVADPFAAFLVIAEKLHGEPAEELTGIDPRAAVDATAIVGADPSIAAFASVGARTRIGAR